MKLPGVNLAVIVERTFHLHHPGRSGISPLKLFFSRPADFYRFAHSFCQSRGFHSCLACMLTTIAGASVWHNYPNIIFWYFKSLFKLFLTATGSLGAGPYGWLVALTEGRPGPRPTRHGGRAGQATGMINRS